MAVSLATCRAAHVKRLWGAWQNARSCFVSCGSKLTWKALTLFGRSSEGYDPS